MSENPMEGTLKLSPSRVEAYQQCPRLYWYRYEPDSPKVTRAPSAALSWGSSMHAALRSIYQQGGPPRVPIAALPGMLDVVWRGEGYGDKETERAAKRRALECLERFLEKHHRQPTMTLYLERFLEATVDGIPFLVRPDRVDMLSPGLLVVEYKSGRTPSFPPHQLTISTLVLEKLHHNPSDRPIQFSLYHLNSGEEQRTELLEEKATEHLSYYGQLRHRILERDFLATPSAQACQFCEAKGICVHAYRPPVRPD
jgi:RecB family exonuclease